MEFRHNALHRHLRCRFVTAFNRLLNIAHISADAATPRAIDFCPTRRLTDTLLGGLVIRHRSTYRCFTCSSLRLISALLRRVNLDSLAIIEVRFALFDKGLHAFFLVFRREHRMKGAAFEQNAFGERHLVGAVDRFLDHHRDRP